MIDYRVIKAISNEAKKSIRRDSDDNEVKKIGAKTLYYTLFYILPVIAGALSYFTVKDYSTVSSFVGTTVAIFTGLFFSLLINISTKIKDKYNDKTSDNTAKLRFKKLMKQISHITQYVILLGVYVLLLSVLYYFISSVKCEVEYFIGEAVTFVIFYFLTKLFVSLFFILQRLYIVTRDEIATI